VVATSSAMGGSGGVGHGERAGQARLPITIRCGAMRSPLRLWFGGPVQRRRVLCGVQAEFAFVVDVQATLAVGPLPVGMPDCGLVRAGRGGDLRPRRASLNRSVQLCWVTVVAGEHLPGRQDLQVLVSGQRRVLPGISVTFRVVGATGLERCERANCHVAVG